MSKIFTTTVAVAALLMFAPALPALIRPTAVPHLPTVATETEMATETAGATETATAMQAATEIPQGRLRVKRQIRSEWQDRKGDRDIGQ
jgi:hypothetical protein